MVPGFLVAGGSAACILSARQNAVKMPAQPRTAHTHEDTLIANPFPAPESKSRRHPGAKCLRRWCAISNRPGALCSPMEAGATLPGRCAGIGARPCFGTAWQSVLQLFERYFTHRGLIIFLPVLLLFLQNLAVDP